MPMSRYEYTDFLADTALLGLLPSQKFTIEEVRRGHRSRIIKAHPDAPGGSTAKAQALNRARERLLEWLKHGAVRWPEQGQSTKADGGQSADAMKRAKEAQERAATDRATAQAAAATRAAAQAQANAEKAKTAERARREDSRAKPGDSWQAKAESEAAAAAEHRKWREDLAAMDLRQSRRDAWARLLQRIMLPLVPFVWLWRLARFLLIVSLRHPVVVAGALAAAICAWPYIHDHVFGHFQCDHVPTPDIWDAKTNSYIPNPLPQPCFEDNADYTEQRNAPPGYIWNALKRRYDLR